MPTIVIVDDEKILRKLVAAALKQCDFEVLEASSARQAVQAASRCPNGVDLLLTELTLPRGNGLDLCRKLEAVAPGLKAVFLSRAPHAERLEEALRAEGRTVLREPFTMPALLDAVTQELGLPSGFRKPPSRAETLRRETAGSRAANGSVAE